MNNEPINEYKEPQMLTQEFLAQLVERGKENIARGQQALRELYQELRSVDEDQ